MNCKFTVGQQVVCINDDWYDLEGCVKDESPALRQIVTIIEVVKSKHHFMMDHIFLKLQGFRLFYHYSYFAPVRETNIDIFKKLLVPTKDLELIQ